MEAQMSVGFLNLFLEWKWAIAESAFRKAIALDSSYALAHRMLGILLSHMGRHRESLSELRRTRELDPLYAMNHALSCLAAFHAGDYAAAIQFGKQATIVDPEFWIGYFQLAQVHAHLGNTAPALDALKSAGQFSGGNSKLISLRGHLLAKIGRYDEAREVLTTLQAISRERYVPPYAVALVHAGLGDRDEALEWLDRAYEARDVHRIFLPVDPKWGDLRASPRFAALLKRCGFAYRVVG
jgi:tetratricopeptide (TPR) repeat protein